MPDADSADSLTYAIPTATLVFLISFALIQWENLWSFFGVVLWLGIPILVYLITSTITLLAQYSGCGTVRIGDVFMYSVPSILLSWAALMISSFSVFRIPIASAVAPLFMDTPPPTSNSGTACCAPPMTLETIEGKAPIVKGFSYGFYLFFSTVYGILVSIGFAGIC